MFLSHVGFSACPGGPLVWSACALALSRHLSYIWSVKTNRPLRVPGVCTNRSRVPKPYCCTESPSAPELFSPILIQQYSSNARNMSFEREDPRGNVSSFRPQCHKTSPLHSVTSMATISVSPSPRMTFREGRRCISIFCLWTGEILKIERIFLIRDCAIVCACTSRGIDSSVPISKMMNRFFPVIPVVKSWPAPVLGRVLIALLRRSYKTHSTPGTSS